MIEHGDPGLAYEESFPGKRTKKNNRTSGLIMMRRPEIFEAIYKHQMDLRRRISDMVLESYQQNGDAVLSVIEKRNILGKIARGELVMPKITFNKLTGEPVVVEKLPDHNDVIRAVELDSKINGDFAPTKKIIDDNRQEAMFDEFSDDEIRKLLEEPDEA